ncbi:Gfo/Idh/MocA family protein [Paenibacillus sp. CF384]|uniref:Gfo/Idh/MocA family protein n=1 Tax=Paenibacillus sp. CF384 TaxID=1884382 RepID=UPI0008946338|nr:Gfo/Idh/MocA family oxidoreductase [Paenibacillus sp. CF384]SDX28754.1 Predicted dehydrogenase [Paenibacillus sp. CF384]
MRAVVVGYGSIGQRHARLLQAMNVETAVVSGRDIDFPIVFHHLKEAVEQFAPNYIIIANKSSEHHSTLLQLIEYHWKGTVLVEKPLYHEEKTLPNDHGLRIFVAYNLRFHPLLLKLRSALKNERLLSITAYAGQYLPTWRLQRDYQLSYSARKEEGGGVLRDLSHELDYLNWLCAGWVRLSALGGQVSSLEITSEDTCGILMEMRECPLVTLQMNYLDRPGRRELLILTDRHTFKIDFSKRLFIQDNHSEVITVDRDETYIAQHTAIMNQQWDRLCSLQEGQDIVRMIDAVERSILNREWVMNE